MTQGSEDHSKPAPDHAGEGGPERPAQPKDGPRVDPDDAVEEASYESFPASDPPAYPPSKIG